ncbi:MAG: tyrosine-type recombinase/integrase [Bacteroidales bacterium]|nr:tyrosine-type recombinase/integrase [Bacteroidales bacterium]
MDFDGYLEDFKYFLSVERSVSNNTTAAYMIDCGRFCEFLKDNYPDISPKEITPQIINGFLDSIILFTDRSEEERLLKATSLTRIIQSIRAFFRFLILTDVIDKDVSQLIITPKAEIKLPVILEQSEIFAMMDAVDTSTGFGVRNRLTIEFLYATGLRVSEFVNLKTENINLKDEYLDIIGKGNKERYVPVAKKVLDDLTYYTDNYRSKIDIKPKDRDYVFISERRKGKMTRQAVNKMLNETALKAGITKKIHPHILRHSFATELIRSGASLIAVKEMMGHASVRSTEIYVNLNTKDLKETLQKYHPFYQNNKTQK